MPDCKHCSEHSGLVSDISHIKESQKTLVDDQKVITRRILFTMLGMIGTLSLMVLNLTIMYYQPAKAIAAEVIK